MGKHCHKCGHEMQAGDVYCPNCKTPSNEELTPERIAEIQANYKTNKKGCAKFISGLFALALLIFTSWIVGGEEGAGTLVLILVFAGLNFILYKMKNKKQTVKSNYYRLSLKEDLHDVDEKCPTCQSVVEDDQLFCTSCGTNLQVDSSNTIIKDDLKPISLRCSECNSELLPGAKFCGSCGNNVENRTPSYDPNKCVSCGEKVETDHKFCGSCGQKITHEEVLS